MIIPFSVRLHTHDKANERAQHNENFDKNSHIEYTSTEYYY